MIDDMSTSGSVPGSPSPTGEYRIDRTDEGVTIELGPEGSPVVLMTNEGSIDLAWAIIDVLGEQ